MSFNDKEEIERVRANFLPDGELDAAIKAVSDKMKGDHTKNRVTVYYLLAEHFGKLPTLS